MSDREEPPQREALNSLQSIVYTRDSFKLLDQRQLPLNTVFEEIKTVQDIWTAIKEMRVRGAPAIAVSAALGIATAANNELRSNPDRMATVGQVQKFLEDSLDYIATSRPTAVNLFNAVTLMKGVVSKDASECKDGAELVERFTVLAESIYDEDVGFNVGIMRNGAKHIMEFDAAGSPQVNILTICNTGALAVSKYGTALGVVRELHYTGNLAQLYACETRPWNQGARLTVYECVKENIPCTLICDSAASSLMRSKKIHAVIVGADRVCRNGDTANKIGTYNLAVSAKHHGVPFYVAAPSTTLDAKTACGADVVIEERETTEITHNMATKERVVLDGPHLSIWNPVFDVTPAELITGGIITEKAVFPPSTTPGAPLFDVTAML